MKSEPRYSPCWSGEVKEHPTKRNRRNTLLWMKDLLEHMSRCHDQLQWASDGETQSFLADALIGDLNECHKLCEQLQDRGSPMSGGRAAWSRRDGPLGSNSREIRVRFSARFPWTLPGSKSLVAVFGHLFA